MILRPVCELSIFPPLASTRKLTKKSPVVRGSYFGTLSAAMSARLDGNSDSTTFISETVMFWDSLNSEKREAVQVGRSGTGRSSTF